MSYQYSSIEYESVPVTSAEDIKDNIDRFFKKHNRLAEAAGAESMLIYIEQRDKVITDLDLKNTRELNRVSDLQMQVRTLESERATLRSTESSLLSQLFKAQGDQKLAEAGQAVYKKVLTEVADTKGFSRFAAKKLREQIIRLIAPAK